MIGSGISVKAAAGIILANTLSCAVQPAATVSLSFQNTPPRYVHTESTADLSQRKIDTKFSHGPSEIFVTGGITESHLETKFKMSFKSMEDTVTLQGCYWPTDINVTVSYAPVVYIASDYDYQSCRYQQTALHELKHVNTDIITINEFLPHIRQSLQTAASALSVTGPFSLENKDQAQEGMMAAIKTALEASVNQMQATRQQRQQAIDTRQEYLRLSKACPDEPIKAPEVSPR